MPRYSTAIVATLVLSACGGGGGTFGSTEIVAMYSLDGSGVSISENIEGRTEPYNATFLVSDTNKASDFADALYRANKGLTVVVDANSYADRSYDGADEGVNDKGELFKVVYVGQSFGSNGYVSANLIELDNQHYAIGTDGRVLGQLPSGTFLYRGSIDIAGGVKGDALESGNFRLSADFDSRTASISGTTTNKFLTANALRISNSGKLTGNGTIGITSFNALDAEVAAYFAGANGGGVHGVAYQTADVEDGMAAYFIGVK